MKTFARQCSVTGELMNEGWVWGDGVFYTKHLADTLAECRKDRQYIVATYDDITDEELHLAQINDESERDEFDAALLRARKGIESDEDLLLIAYHGDYLYFTDWEDDPEEHQYGITDDGTIVEL